MKDSLLIGDHLFAKKFAYGIPTPTIPWIELQVLPDFNNNGHLIEGDKPQRRDIVVFRYPHNPKVHYVKRCVATGGDILFIRDKILYLRPKEGDSYIKKNYPKENIISINGMLFVKNPYIYKYPGIQTDPNVIDDGIHLQAIFNFGPIIVPENEFFMFDSEDTNKKDNKNFNGERNVFRQ